MDSQAHRVGRQILKVRFAAEKEARETLPRLRTIAEDGLAAALEAVLDQVSARQGDGSFGRVEIDLGRIEPAWLERDLVRRLTERLPAALRDAARQAPIEQAGLVSAPQTRPAALPLLAFFARTGRLPWWQGWRETSLDDVFAEAARTDRAALRELLARLCGEGAPLERLVRHLSDAVLTTAIGADADALAALAPPGIDRAAWRSALWPALLANASGNEWLTTARRLAEGMSAPTPMREAGTRRTEETDSAPARTAPADRVGAQSRGSPEHDPAMPIADLPPLSANDPQPTSGDTRSAEATLRLPRGEVEAVPDASPEEASLVSISHSRVQTGTADAAATQGERRQVEGARTQANNRPTDPAADLCPIENAGLVLLWPFLPRYFATLGLTDEQDRFISAGTRHRATLALHAVATGEREAAEWWLPLPKLMCAIPIDAACLPGPPLDDRELEEAASLRAAVAAHLAPDGRLSPSALADDFLLRPGTLATRDGAWLLRVERRPYDVLLDALPWTLAWIRLPWMDAAMRVEW